ncbi:hypothetical protein [Natronosalvus rutilus]|uniref:Uncharacterized protein n=1 Tax=Natronosalvus rutilus TaxID=2953753 RepID=A0A9E7N811_9EURY|nr:hypothetical protein [Natronosalvus rutilus]UTF53160.1 hypothetical protein NGM29_15505 [Natronosalvus rutilus]
MADDATRSPFERPPTEDSTSHPIETWQLTPTNSRLLRGLLYASWTISGGFVVLLATLSAFLALEGAVPSRAGSMPGLTVVVVVALVVTLAGFGWLLTRLVRCRHGRTFLRLRAPEPSDPTRSVVEHAPIRSLVAFAGVGAVIHAGGFALVLSLERSSFWYLLPVGAVYAILVAVRWWLPTASRLTDDVLVVTSFPHEGAAGSRWFGTLETTLEIDRASIQRVRARSLGETTLVWLDRGRSASVVAAVPPSVRDRLEG